MATLESVPPELVNRSDAQRAEVMMLQSMYGDELTLLSDVHGDTIYDNADSFDSRLGCISEPKLPTKPVSSLLLFSIVRIECQKKVTVIFKLPYQYPEDYPIVEVSFSSNISPEIQSKCLVESQTVAKSYTGEQCVYQIAEGIFAIVFNNLEEEEKEERCGDYDLAASLKDVEVCISCNTSNKACSQNKHKSPSSAKYFDSKAVTVTQKESLQQCVCVVAVDHMHNRKLYLKNLCNWCARLDSCTVVMTTKPPWHILVVLIGSERQVEQFLQTWKTQNVDVDSRGRPCKERMTKVLCKGMFVLENTSKHLTCSRSNSKTTGGVLETVECDDVGDIRTVFQQLGLLLVYDSFVKL